MLTAFFHSYKNTLHAYADIQQVKLKCCEGPPPMPPCNHSCDTTLNYCFREFSTKSVNLSKPLEDCVNDHETSGLLEDTDYIDYAIPPRTADGNFTAISMKLRGDTWHVRMLTEWQVIIISIILISVILTCFH